MSSKHYRWQTRWRLDPAARSATHDTGLIVTFSGPPGNGGPGRLVNADAVAAALAPRHGPHNVPPMLDRMAREARELYDTHPQERTHARH